MAYSLDQLLANLGATFDFHFGDASGHLTELIAAQNTTSETALTYGAKGLASVPYSAVTFNGTTSIATAPSNAAFNLGDGPFFLLAAFKPADIGTNRVLIDRGHTTANGYMLLRGTDNTYRLVDSSAGTIIARTGVIADTTAVHTLITTKNGATSKVYWDGTDVTVVGTNVTLGNATDALSLGAQSGFAFFSGTIYRLSGGTVALTATQAKVLSDLVLSQPYGITPLAPHFPQVGPPGLQPVLRTFVPSAGPSGPVANQSTLTASLSFTGSLVKQTAHGMTAGLSFTGTLTKAISHILPAGGLSFTGTLTRRTGKALTAGLSFTGSISRQVGKALTAGLSFTGSLPRAITRGLAATLTFNGSLTKRTAHILPGATLTFNGALATLKAFGVTLTASLSFNGSLTRRPGKALTASLGFAGSLPRAISHGMSASLSFTGSLPRRTSRTLTASLSFTGTVTKSLRRTLTGALSFAGSVVATFHSGAGSIGGIVRGTASAIHAIPGAVISHLRPDGGANRATPSGGASHPTPSGDADHEVPR